MGESFSDVISTKCRLSHSDEHPSWTVLSKLPVAVTTEAALKGFCVRNLLELQKGQVFETVLPETEDVPLKASDIQVAWSEFEVVNGHLFARLTRLI